MLSVFQTERNLERLYPGLLPKYQLAVSEERMQVTGVVKGLQGTALPERLVNALMARFRLITVAVSQS